MDSRRYPPPASRMQAIHPAPKEALPAFPAGHTKSRVSPGYGCWPTYTGMQDPPFSVPAAPDIRPSGMRYPHHPHSTAIPDCGHTLSQSFIRCGRSPFRQTRRSTPGVQIFLFPCSASAYTLFVQDGFVFCVLHASDAFLPHFQHLLKKGGLLLMAAIEQAPGISSHYLASHSLYWRMYSAWIFSRPAALAFSMKVFRPASTSST